MIDEIERNKGIITALDIEPEKAAEIIIATEDVGGVVAHKLGFPLILRAALPDSVMPDNLLYQHNSGGTDIPAMGKQLADILSSRKEFKGVILTPTAGPETMTAFVTAAKEADLEVYLEPILQHEKFLVEDGGYIMDDAYKQMITLGFVLDIDGLILPETVDDKILEAYRKEVTCFTRYSDGELNDAFSDTYREFFGFNLIEKGIKKVWNMANQTSRPLILDWQKAGTSGPEVARNFAGETAYNHAAIIFPQAGPVTAAAYIQELNKSGVDVIVGGLMTHTGYLQQEGGFLSNEMPEQAYSLAVSLGVTDFVVPGNKPEFIEMMRELYPEVSFYSPGFLDKYQGGKISDAGKAAGDNWYAIVGRGITQAKDPRAAAIELTSQL